MYEVQNRSIYEHQQFSFGVERRNLKWLQQANTDFVQEMARVQLFETLADHGQLKGKAFKLKALNPRRLKGVSALGAAGFTWGHLVPLKLMFGPTAPLAFVSGSLLYGMFQLNENSVISAIEPINEGEFAGRVRVTIQESLFVSRSIIVEPRNANSIADDDMGQEDYDGSIVAFSAAVDEATGEAVEGGAFILPADAYRDVRFMEWFLSFSDHESKTDADFNNLIFQNHEDIASTGGLTGIAAFNARTTGFANVQLGDEVERKLDGNELVTDENLRAMRDHYGGETLDKMSASELYRAYRAFVSHK